jgi:NSS family neurotransmitter:Na+ symporter
MAEGRVSIHGQWSSRLAFILAATGSAVGLGNVWKFPYVAGASGGGAFVLIYLLCIALIGIPIMIAEVMLGRIGRQSPINTMRTLASEQNRSPLWQLIGWGGVVSAFLILSFYSVIAGWVVAYAFRAAAGTFQGLTADGVTAIFAGLEADPERMLAWHTIFMVMTAIVVARGVEQGLEKAVRFLMPALFIMLVVMVGYAMNTDAFGRGLAFLFKPDFAQLDAQGVLSAMGQAFFSLSLGMGAIMMYGSYLPRHESVVSSSITIALADTGVALLAGMAIFPIVFANGLSPEAGPALIFQTLPVAFGQMPGGSLFGTVFFALLVVAAWTSAISLIEPVVGWMVESHGMTRVSAATTAGIGIWILGIGSILSFNRWSDVTLFGQTVFGLFDFLATNVLLPLGGLFIALFATWMLRRHIAQEELDITAGPAFQTWRFLAGVVAPIGVVVIFVSGMIKALS